MTSSAVTKVIAMMTAFRKVTMRNIVPTMTRRSRDALSCGQGAGKSPTVRSSLFADCQVKCFRFQKEMLIEFLFY